MSQSVESIEALLARRRALITSTGEHYELMELLGKCIDANETDSVYVGIDSLSKTRLNRQLVMRLFGEVVEVVNDLQMELNGVNAKLDAMANIVSGPERVDMPVSS
jgi:AAA+ superfamily predicted ATPase